MNKLLIILSEKVKYVIFEQKKEKKEKKKSVFRLNR